MNPKCWCGHTLEQHTITGFCREMCNECECKSFTLKDDRASASTIYWHDDGDTVEIRGIKPPIDEFGLE